MSKLQSGPHMTQSKQIGLLLVFICSFLISGCDEEIHMNNQQIISRDSAVFPIPLTKKYYLPALFTSGYIEPSKDYQSFKTEYLKQLHRLYLESYEQSEGKTNTEEVTEFGKFLSLLNGPLAEPSDIVSVSDEYIKAYFEYNKSIQPYENEIRDRSFVPNFDSTVSFSKIGHCYVVHAKNEKDGIDNKQFIAFEKIEENTFLVTQNEKKCFEFGEEEFFEIKFAKYVNGDFIYFNRNEGYQSYVTFADWARSLPSWKQFWYGIKIDDSKLNGKVGTSPEVDGYSAPHIVSTEADKEHDLTVIVNKSRAYKAYFKTNELSLKASEIPSFLSERYDHERLVYQAHAKLSETRLKLIEEESVRQKERLEKERQAAAEKERQRLAAIAAEAERKKKAELREAKNREDIFYFAGLDGADVYYVTRTKVSQLSGIGEISTGFLGMSKQSTINFDYTPFANDQNTNNIKSGETHQYFKYLGNDRFEVISKITNNVAGRSCRNSWIPNGNTVGVESMKNNNFTIDTPYIWEVSTIGRECKYAGIDVQACSFEKCIEYERNPSSAYLVHGKKNAETIFNDIREYVDYSKTGKRIRIP